jgi:transcriptional regulator with XRE-family HTH domain
MHLSGKENAMMVGQMNPGRHLRDLRLQSGFTLREVHSASLRIATQLENRAFIIPPSRLCELETKKIVPSIYRLYTLAQLYHCSLPELMSWYGVPT